MSAFITDEQKEIVKATAQVISSWFSSRGIPPLTEGEIQDWVEKMGDALSRVN